MLNSFENDCLSVDFLQKNHCENPRHFLVKITMVVDFIFPLLSFNFLCFEKSRYCGISVQSSFLSLNNAASIFFLERDIMN